MVWEWDGVCFGSGRECALGVGGSVLWEWEGVWFGSGKEFSPDHRVSLEDGFYSVNIFNVDATLVQLSGP